MSYCVFHKTKITEMQRFLQRVGITASYASAVYATAVSVRLSVRLSVRPSSHAGIVSRQMKLRSCGFHQQVGQSS